MDSAGAVTRAVADFAAEFLDTKPVGVSDDPDRPEVCVGLSGGPDSLALTAGAVRAGLRVRALVVDHGLQQGSARVAHDAAQAATRLGAEVSVLSVAVGTAGGPEAAARAARYAALDAARGGAPVLLGHTLDDQAETVLLGLARGSGARSIAGMVPWSPPWGRPLLSVRRRDTVGACTQLGLTPYDDPHNRQARFTRVRLRTEVLPLLDDVVHGGVAEALARTASALRADTEALDGIAGELYGSACAGDDLTVAELAGAAPAVRTRVLRLWLRDVGATEPTSRVIRAVDALVVGAGGSAGRTASVAIGGDPRVRVVVTREGGRLVVRREKRVPAG